MGASLPALTQRMATGVYHLDNVGFSGVSVLTNAVSTTAYRGAGRPEAAVAIERMVDRFAAEIGMDAADVRRRNYVAPFTAPYTTGIGSVYDVGDYPASLELALAAAGYDGLRAEQARRRASGDPVAFGIGIATYVEVTAGVQTPEPASVEVADDGHLVVRSGATPYGQGHETTWAMIVADATGEPVEHIEVVHGDTDLVPAGGLTVGSRSVHLVGVAVAAATTELVVLARQRASERLEAHVADVVLDPATGRFHVTGTPARSLGWGDLVDGDGDGGAGAGRLAAQHLFEPVTPTYPFGTHVAVVEVDTDDRPRPAAPPCRRRRRRDVAQPLARRGPDPRRDRPGRGPGAARGRALRRRRPAADGQLRRLPGDRRRRAAVVRARPDGDPDVRQRARRQGRR